LTDDGGNVTPELFKTKSQARKEAKQLRKEMNYSREYLRICPAKWSKRHNTVELFNYRTSSRFARIAMEETPPQL